MHELGIAASVLDAIRAEADLRPGARIVKVGLRVGELSGVDRDALSFCFESLVTGTEFAPLTLDIEYRPRANRCPACDFTFPVEDYDTACPRCRARDTEPAGGDELEFAYMEIEQDEPSPAGKEGSQ